MPQALCPSHNGIPGITTAKWDVHFYVAAVVKLFLCLFSFLYSGFKEPFAIGRMCIAHLSHASAYEQTAP
jgi:hypothetical protein